MICNYLDIDFIKKENFNILLQPFRICGFEAYVTRNELLKLSSLSVETFTDHRLIKFFFYHFITFTSSAHFLLPLFPPPPPIFPLSFIYLHSPFALERTKKNKNKNKKLIPPKFWANVLSTCNRKFIHFLFKTKKRKIA